MTTSASQKPSETPPKRIALALGSSFLGYIAHAGFLTQMDAHGFRPCAIAGSSAGAIAGGLYAAGLRGDELKNTLCSRRFMNAFFDYGIPFRIPAVLLGRPRTGILKGNNAVKAIQNLVGDQNIEDLTSPTFSPCVTDIERQESEVLTEGNLATAIIASASIPKLFSPQKINDRYYYDGGISDEAPFDHWLHDDSIDEIIIHRVISHVTPQNSPAPPKPFFNSPYAACHAHVGERLLHFRLQYAKQLGKKVTIAITRHKRPGPLPFLEAPTFFRAGEDTACKLWATPN